jgi:leucyl aminopeptidase
MTVRIAKQSTIAASSRKSSASTTFHIYPCFEGVLEFDFPAAKSRGGSGRTGAASGNKPTIDKFVKRVLKTESFSGRVGETLKIHLPDGLALDSLMIVGLGKRDQFRPETLRKVVATAFRRLPGTVRGRKQPIQVHLDPEALARDDVDSEPSPGPGRLPEGANFGLGIVLEALAEGWLLGGYRFVQYQTGARSKSKPTPDLEVTFTRPPTDSAASLRASLKRGEAIAEAVAFARDLGNMPANDLRPDALARRTRQWAKKCGLDFQVLDEKAIRREKMGAFLSVAQGSTAAPRFMILKYTPPPGRARGARGKKPLVFVGKAVTFDSGGISIKPARGMEDMKMDMMGGGAVLAALGAIAKIRPGTPAIGVIPCAENMISGDATRPGDIVESRAGLTIEVINTDAEGRMILADALDYSRRFNPALVVDLATLTGACVVALGDVVSGLFSNDSNAAERVRQASIRSGELVWELPLYTPYFDQIRSTFADIKNSGGRLAGAITAAAFLARFAEGLPWCHLDVAGTAWCGKESGYRSRGATGFGVRLLVELACESR